MKNNNKYEYKHTQALQEQSPLVLPKSAVWNGISIERHSQPAAECELCLPQHTFCILLNEGYTERRVDGGHLLANRAEPGEVLFYPAFSQHWIRWQKDAEFLLLFLDSSLITQDEENIADYDAIEAMERKREFRDPLVQQIGLALNAELDGGMVDSSALYAESLATALSAHLLRHYSTKESIVRDITSNVPNAPMQRVIEYIHYNLAQQLTIAELSFIANLSPYHFSRTFKQATGMAPHQYVLHIRIDHAKELLLQGNLSIAEVATRVGFFDQSHFTRYFKRIVGITPQTLLQQKSKKILILP